MATNRLEVLQGLVEQNPTDSRTRYMLAMELANGGDLEAAVKEYRTVLTNDPNYGAAYYHGGQTLEKLNRTEEARAIYQQGIEACASNGDAHTQSELQEALEAL